MEILRRGSRGPNVKQVQAALNKAGHHLKVDGDFGAKTEAAVIAFQRKHRLVRDGIVGPRTRAALLPGIHQPKKRRRARKAKVAEPRIITAAQLGLRFQNVFGAKGAVYRGAGHYSAGHRCKDAADLIREAQSDHAYHASKGWGGLSYEAMVADDGTILLGNPMDRKAAAVAMNNTGMVGICCPGTVGDRMTEAQRASIRWLLANWHTRAIPKPHRLPRPAHGLTWLPHKRWPGQSTQCPDVMENDYKELWR